MEVMRTFAPYTLPQLIGELCLLFIGLEEVDVNTVAV